MADTQGQNWNDNKAADAVYRSNTSAAPSAGPDTVAQGTGQMVDLPKSAPASQSSGESLGEVAARLKAQKMAKSAPKSAKPVKPAGSYKKGGKIKKTAIYRLHKGERVLNPKQTKKADKMSGMKKVLSGK